MRLGIRNLNESVDKTKFVTNHNPLAISYERKGKKPPINDFSIDGVFSTAIFGNMAAGAEDYSCNCGTLHGKFNKGLHCNKCNSVVEYKNLSTSREGWIDCEVEVFHPLIFKMLEKVIGRTCLNNMLDSRVRIKLYGEIIEPEMKWPYEGIGIQRLIDNFEKIIKEATKKKPQYAHLAEFILTNKEIAFAKYFPIINSRLRPALSMNGDISFDVINNHYNMIVSCANTIRDLSTIERTEIIVEPLAYKIQMAIQEVYNSIMTSLNSRDGYIHGLLLGNRNNYSSRMVIAPLPAGHGMDEIALPYQTVVELLRPQIIRKISAIKKCTLTQADAYINILEVQPLVLQISKELLKSENVGVLVNRNP